LENSSDNELLEMCLNEVVEEEDEDYLPEGAGEEDGYEEHQNEYGEEEEYQHDPDELDEEEVDSHPPPPPP
jgi:hypothetical protein